MITDKLAGVKQPQAEATDLAGVVRVDLVELFEELGSPLQPMIRVPLSVMVRESSSSVDFARKGDFASLRGELDGVVEEGVDGKGNAAAVDPDGGQLPASLLCRINSFWDAAERFSASTLMAISLRSS